MFLGLDFELVLSLILLEYNYQTNAICDFVCSVTSININQSTLNLVKKMYGNKISDEFNVNDRAKPE